MYRYWKYICNRGFLMLIIIRSLICIAVFLTSGKGGTGAASVAEFLLITGGTDTIPTVAAVIGRSTGVGKSVFFCFVFHIRFTSPETILIVILYICKSGDSRKLFRFPASGSTTWKYQSIGGYRKSDFLRIYMTVKIFELSCEHICQYSRSKSCSIGIDKEKQRIRA